MYRQRRRLGLIETIGWLTVAMAFFLSLSGTVWATLVTPSAGNQNDAPAANTARQLAGLGPHHTKQVRKKPLGRPGNGTCNDYGATSVLGQAGDEELDAANSDDPIYLFDGEVIERRADISLPGVAFGWAHHRDYSSQLTTLSGTEFDGENGIRWKTSGLGPYMRLNGDDLELYGSSATMREFTGDGEPVPTFTSPEDYDATVEKTGSGPDSYTLTEHRTGNVFKFDGLDVYSTNKGRLHSMRSREFKTASQSGNNYSYDANGNVSSATTSQGWSVIHTYNTTGSEVDRLKQIDVENGSSTVIRKVEYKYYGTTTSAHNDIGTTGDLTQVKVSSLNSDESTWDVKTTLYRYYRTVSDGRPHQVKMVFDPDAVERITSAGNSAVDTPEEIMTKADSYVVANSMTIEDYASRKFTYYTSNTSTSSITTPWGSENLHSKYGGSEASEYDTYHYGKVKTETIQSGGSSGCCGGSSGSGITLTYSYMLLNGGTSTDVNEVVRLIVEDKEDGTGANISRKISGLNNRGSLLREATITDPTSGTLEAWCTSTTLDSDGRVSETRSASAHTAITSNSNMTKFLNPTTSTNDSDTLDNTNGLVEVSEYTDSSGKLISVATKVKKGENGTAYYTSYTEFGDDSNDEPNWLPIETRVYQAKVTANPATNGKATTYSYTFHDAGDTQVKIKTTTQPTVSTGENGSGTATTMQEYYDELGRLRWTKDGEGYVNYYSYHPDTGGLAYEAIDVDTSSLSSEIVYGSGGAWISWSGSAGLTRSASTTPLELVTKTYFDDLGRPTRTIDPASESHYLAYGDSVSYSFPHFKTTASERLLPISVTEVNDGGRVTEQYQVDPDRADVVSFVPVGLSSGTNQSHYVTWAKNTYDDVSGQLVYADRYHDIPSSGDGTLSTNYYRSISQYDSQGRSQYTIQIVSGTSVANGVEQVTKQSYDVLDRVTQVERGVSAAGASMGSDYTSYPTLSKLTATIYDSDAIGDGYVTQVKNYFGTGTNDFVGSNYYYDFRGRRKGVEPFYMSGSTETPHSPYSVTDYDWDGNQTYSAQYTTTRTWSSVVSSDSYTPLNSSNRVNYSQYLIDDLGRVYESRRYNGTTSYYLETDRYYDRKGRVVAVAPKDQAATENAYDGVGRSYQTRRVASLETTKYSSGAFQYRAPVPDPSLSSMSGGDDKVYTLAHQEFDSAGNAIASHQFEIVHNDGTLGIDLTGNDDYVRHTIYQWYDNANRLTETGDYGSGDTAAGEGTWEYASVPSRSSTAPTVSADTVMLTKYEYDADSGRPTEVTVWSDGSTSHVTKTWHDDLGRKSFVAQNYINFSPPSTNSGGSDVSEDRVTGFTYDGSGQLVTLTALDQDGNGNTSDNEVTTYLYEDTVNAALVTNEIYPDSSDTTSSGSNQVKYTYNVDGSQATRTDPRGTVLTYAYDDLRRLETNSVTTLGGADSTVRSVKRVYDSQGRLESISSHSGTAGSGSVVNEIEYEYNGLNQISTSYQSHSGAVNTSTSPSVDYTYDATRSGNSYTRRHRLEKVTQPSGRVTYYGYNTGTSDSIHNRTGLIRELRQTSSGGTQYSEYEYLGSGRLAAVDYQAPDIELDRYQAGSGTSYAGYDRFGRIKDQFWDGYGSTADVSRVNYGYDYVGNRLWREDVIAANSSYHHDELYTYDGLHRVVDSERGDINGTYTAISSNKNYAEDWTLDALGNWTLFKQDDDGNGSWDLSQLRGHNKANEVVNIQLSSSHVAHDAAGDMTKVPEPEDWSAHYDLTYDGWNRLTKVVDGGTTLAEFRYDGQNRRVVKYDGSAASPNAKYDFFYNTKWQVLEVQKDSDSDPLEEYLWHPYYIDALAVRFYDSDTNGSQTTYYSIHDANFNVVAMTSTSGTVNERYQYSAYGDLKVLDADFSDDADNVSDIANPCTYTGRRLDSETGLYQYRNRYYHAQLGRFVTRDPIGYEGSQWNLFEYTNGMPTAGLDPFGLRNPQHHSFPRNALRAFENLCGAAIEALGAVFEGKNVTPENFMHLFTTTLAQNVHEDYHRVGVVNYDNRFMEELEKADDCCDFLGTMLDVIEGTIQNSDEDAPVHPWDRVFPGGRDINTLDLYKTYLDAICRMPKCPVPQPEPIPDPVGGPVLAPVRVPVRGLIPALQRIPATVGGAFSTIFGPIIHIEDRKDQFGNPVPEA